MIDTIALDVHAHLVPIVPEKLVALAHVAWDPARQALTLDGHAIGAKSLFQPDSLLRWMDENTIEHAWISIPPPAYRQELGIDAARAWAAYVNDGLAAIAAQHSGRLSALLHLPVEHPALAVEIARRGGRKFAMSAGAGPQVRLSDAAYTALWEVLDANAAFLFIHPGTTCDPRLDRFFLRNLTGNPVETGVAVSHLVMSGAMTRYTRMTVCLAHGGGIVPSIAGRLQHGWAARATGEDQSGPPRDALRRFCVDCITHSPDALTGAAAVFGDERVVFGSDWPFPMGLMAPHKDLAPVDAPFRRRILGVNARRLRERFACVPTD